MKTIKQSFKTFAVFVCMLSVSFIACSKKHIFDNFGDNENISTVYISSAAMNLGMSLGSDIGSGLGLDNNCIRNPQGMEIISSDTEEGAAIIRKELEQKIKELGMELLLSTSEDNETCNIYTGKVQEGTTVRDILIETSETGEYSLVYIKGDIDLGSLTSGFRN